MILFNLLTEYDAHKMYADWWSKRQLSKNGANWNVFKEQVNCFDETVGKDSLSADY